MAATAMRIFSGIQPTGDKHFGNYSGGFRQYAATQREALAAGGAAFFCVVDLHSITVEHDPAGLRKSTLDLAAMLFATGLDPELSTVFVQSHNPAHAEAAWLLAAVTSYGELRRMTQFKEKSADHDFVSAGLFTYPVLMAADILLYQTTVVPVGDDQRQHLELSRDVAQRFNQRFGPTFTLPEGQFPTAGARIMDLTEPTKRMSTSASSEAGKILMVDPPDAIRRKIMGAVTDTGREVRRAPDKPGITNLVDILSVASGVSAEEIEDEFAGTGYGAFKKAVAEAVVECLEPIAARYRELRSDPTELERLLAAGAAKAVAASQPTIDAMYERMGFTRRQGD
ncbi:MAG: tryptophan--tRNA ligase [Candidatus Dormibacteraeota bacterium]|nr:tryptophan--tRNA ligase [Candidatus Dormibacteraeota bacterium]